jgi:hypothetical protein
LTHLARRGSHRVAGRSSRLKRIAGNNLVAVLVVLGIAAAGTLAIYVSHAATSAAHIKASAFTPPCNGSAGCLALGSQRQLFVDKSFINSLSGGASLVLQHPQVADASLIQNKPWEGSWGEGESTVDDNGHYFMYYQCGPDTTDGNDNLGTPVNVCVVESTDGITWNRPDLGQVSFDGSTNNNILSIPDQADVGTQFYPFIDTNPAAPANQRFKAVAGGNVSYQKADGTTWIRGLYLMVSADGIHWTEYSTKPFLPDVEQQDSNGNYITLGSYDSLNTMSYDATLQEYVCYYRLWTPEPTTNPSAQYRWVGISTSKDLKTWTPWGKAMGYGGQPQQWYFGDTFPYYRAPQTYVAMPSEYVNTASLPLSGLFQNPVTAGHGTRSATHFAVVGSNGTSYDRSLDPTDRWITTGLDNPAPLQFGPGQQGYPDWAGRLGLNVVPTGPTQMSMYLEQPGRVVRYTLRTDGFVALNAGTGGGEMESKPFTFSGKALEVNYQALSGGSLRVELETANGKAIPGLDLSHSVPMTGNQISQTVSWTSGDNVSALAGATVRVKFVLNNVNVYSMAFDASP